MVLKSQVTEFTIITVDYEYQENYKFFKFIIESTRGCAFLKKYEFKIN